MDLCSDESSHSEKSAKHAKGLKVCHGCLFLLAGKSVCQLLLYSIIIHTKDLDNSQSWHYGWLSSVRFPATCPIWEC